MIFSSVKRFIYGYDVCNNDRFGCNIIKCFFSRFFYVIWLWEDYWLFLMVSRYK